MAEVQGVHLTGSQRGLTRLPPRGDRRRLPARVGPQPGDLTRPEPKIPCPVAGRLLRRLDVLPRPPDAPLPRQPGRVRHVGRDQAGPPQGIPPLGCGPFVLAWIVLSRRGIEDAVDRVSPGLWGRRVPPQVREPGLERGVEAIEEDVPEAQPILARAHPPADRAPLVVREPLPWRREVAVHLEELGESAAAKVLPPHRTAPSRSGRSPLQPNAVDQRV